MKYIFLDVDGVLNHERTPRDHLEKECVENLRAVVENTSATIVLSSTWRTNSLDVRRLDSFLKAHSFAGITSLTPDFGGQATRTEEIVSWLFNFPANRPSIESFVCIDDMDLLSSTTPFVASISKHFVRTKMRTGLSRDNVSQCTAILNDPNFNYVTWRSGVKDMAENLKIDLKSLSISLDEYACGGPIREQDKITLCETAVGPKAPALGSAGLSDDEGSDCDFSLLDRGFFTKS